VSRARTQRFFTSRQNPQNAQTAKSVFFNLGETRSETLVRNPYVSSSHKIERFWDHSPKWKQEKRSCQKKIMKWQSQTRETLWNPWQIIHRPSPLQPFGYHDFCNLRRSRTHAYTKTLETWESTCIVIRHFLSLGIFHPRVFIRQRT